LDGVLAGEFVIDVDVRDGSDGDEDVSFGEFGELLGGVIFVDDGVDALEALQDFGLGDGDATTAGGDDDGAVCDELFDGAFFDDVDGLR